MKKAFRLLFRHFCTQILGIRMKPRVIQMPITNRCNSRCATCNIWKDQSEPIEMDAVSLKKALEDPFFRQVTDVGINGGEPTTYKQIEALLDALFVLKKLKRIHFISNGLISSKLLPMMKTLKTLCKERNIKVLLSISIDGVGDIHDDIRGVPHAFEKTLHSFHEIQAHRAEYCDYLDVGTTLSQKNIEHIVEIEELNASLGVKGFYHLAVPNKRLHNFSKDQDFDIMNSERTKLLATEYFYGKFKKEKDWKTRLKSFLTYLYLQSNGTVRLAGCNYLRSDVTISENLDFYLCATASDKIGNLKEKSASLYVKEGALRREEKKVQAHCSHCVHYIIFPTFKGMFLFINEVLKPRVWIQYKLKSLWLK